MESYVSHYLAARFDILDIALLARLRAWRESRQALRDWERLDPHLRADIGLVPDGIHPPVADFVPAPTEGVDLGLIAANDNLAAEAA